MTRPILWALGTLAGASLWVVANSDQLAARRGPAPEQTRTESGSRVIEVSADLRGHFTVHPVLDGKRLRMMVDTGATLVALTHEDARAIGVKVSSRDFTSRTGTANGVVAVAPVRIAEMRIGEITVRNVDAVVLPEGRLGTSLLGMSFLKRLAGFEVSKGRLTLRG